jgi:hypothetical protein
VLKLSRRHVIRVVYLSVVALCVGLSIYRLADRGTATAATSAPRSAASIDWANPLGDGSSVATADSLRTASVDLGFTPTSPDSSLDATPIVEVNASTQSMAYVYRSPSSQFVVAERSNESSEAELQSLAGPCESHGCEGKWTTTNLANGESGLLVDNPLGTTTVMFIHNGILYTIMGPPSTFSADDAVAVANAMVRGADAGATPTN